MARLLERPAHTVLEAGPTVRAARTLHPWGWWVWAIAVGVSASLLMNLAVLCLMGAALVVVMRWRRPAEVWARSIRFYLVLAGLIVTLRLVFHTILGTPGTGTVLFTLPEVRLPAWAAGIRFGGPVVLESLLWTASDAARLAVMILAVGAAMTLADPRSALRSVPAALHDISAAVAITLTVFPQLISSAFRINRGRRLRGRSTKGVRSLLGTIVPVLEDAVEGSMTLATSMEVRGYGRTREQRKVGVATTLALFTAVLALMVGIFVLLGVAPSSVRWLGMAPSTWLGLALMGGGAALAVVALMVSGRRLAVTRYRPAPWGRPENTMLALSGLIIAYTLWLDSPVSPVVPANPSEWPSLSLPLLLVPVMVLLAGVIGRPR